YRTLKIKRHTQNDNGCHQKVSVGDYKISPVAGTEPNGHRQQMERVNGDKTQMSLSRLTGPVIPVFGYGCRIGNDTTANIQSQHDSDHNLQRRPARIS